MVLGLAIRTCEYNRCLGLTSVVKTNCQACPKPIANIMEPNCAMKFFIAKCTVFTLPKKDSSKPIANIMEPNYAMKFFIA
jgi:hypothetical protein